MDAPDSKGMVDIQASNARVKVHSSRLSVSNVDDAIVADQKAIYGDLVV